MYIDVTLIAVALFGLITVMLAALVIIKGISKLKIVIIPAVMVLLLLLNLVTVNIFILLLSLAVLFYLATIRIGNQTIATNLRLSVCLSFILVAVTFTVLAPSLSTLKITTIEEKLTTPFQIIGAENVSVNGKESSSVKILGTNGEELVLTECTLVKQGTGINDYVKEKTTNYKNLYTVGKYIVRILEGKTYQNAVYLK